MFYSLEFVLGSPCKLEGPIPTVLEKEPLMDKAVALLLLFCARIAWVAVVHFFA